MYRVRGARRRVSRCVPQDKPNHPDPTSYGTHFLTFRRFPGKSLAIRRNRLTEAAVSLILLFYLQLPFSVMRKSFVVYPFSTTSYNS